MIANLLTRDRLRVLCDGLRGLALTCNSCLAQAGSESSILIDLLAQRFCKVCSKTYNSFCHPQLDLSCLESSALLRE